jgi:glyoxylate/hydroxypyruvate reductase A
MAVVFASTPERAKVFAEHFARELPDLPFYEGQAPVPENVKYLISWAAPADLETTYPNLEVIFSIGAGVDQFDFNAVPPHVHVVRMLEPGIRDQMREYVAMATLALHRDLPDYLVRQRAGVWEAGLNHPASERHVGVMGLGHLGLAVLDALKPFGFQLSGWSRSKKQVPGVGTHTDLDTFLRTADILICLLPLTDQTRGLLNKKVFVGLPKGAALVHVGRGPQLDQAALVAALDSGHLSAAWLDVTDPEPLPAGHPLWSHEKVIITPHIASQTRAKDAARHVVAGINAHSCGHSMPGQVNRVRGY